jgi:hypothetical protein
MNCVRSSGKTLRRTSATGCDHVLQPWLEAAKEFVSAIVAVLIHVLEEAPAHELVDEARNATITCQ